MKIGVGLSDRGEIEIWYFACPSSDAPRSVRIERTDAKFSVEGSVGVWSATRTAPLRPHDVPLKVSVSGGSGYTVGGELATVPEFMNAVVEFDGGTRQVISFKGDELVQGSVVVMQDRSLFPERVVSAEEFQRRNAELCQ